MTFFEDDFFGRSSGAPANWQKPRLSDVISPDANGATLDTQGLLSGPIVEVSPGRFQVPVVGGTAQTDADTGAVMLFPFRDRNGAIVQYEPRGFGVRITWHTGFANSSGGVIAVGRSTDASGTKTQYCAADWGSTEVRGRGGLDATFAVSTINASGADVEWHADMLAGPNGTTNKYDVTTSLFALRDSTGNRVAFQSVPASTDAGVPYFMISVFGSAVLGAKTVEFTAEYWYDESPDGERV